MALPAPALLQRFPFITLAHALRLLRWVTAGLFMAHAVVRITSGSTVPFGAFMESRGFAPGVAWVWAITAVELLAGTAMALGVALRTAATALFVVAAGGIVLIHRHFGWFVGEHGSGGSEYSVALMVALLVIAASAASPPRDLA